MIVGRRQLDTKLAPGDTPSPEIALPCGTGDGEADVDGARGKEPWIIASRGLGHHVTDLLDWLR
jgi:hypothetical protein